MAWYDAGTVNVTVNSATVTGTGTKWLAGARQGEAFVAPDGRLYEVLNVASDTSLTLTKPYIGATATAQKYALAPMQGYVKELADRVAALLLLSQEEWGSVLKAADLQASPNDATSGKILAVGRSFGLGSVGAANSYDLWPSASINDQNVPAGVYYVNSTISDLPLALTSGIVWHRQAGTAGGQTLESGDGKLLHRGRRSGAYTGWKQTLDVGDFGFGLAQASPPNGKASSNPTGFYYASGAAPAFGGGAFFLDLAYNTTAINSGLRISTDPYTDNFYMNGAVSGRKTFRDACKLVHDKNIVGDVAAGSVIATGSNANGTWVRFADGTQMCWSPTLTSNWVDVQAGGMYTGQETYWTFPMTFVSSTPYVVHADTTGTNNILWASTGPSRSGSGVGLKINSPIKWNEGFAMRAVAIGRWKA